MNRQADPGWLPTLVGVLAFIGSLLVGRGLDWALGGVWGTVASLVLIFGAVAAYGAWHRRRKAQRIDLETHELPPPAAKERWSRRLVAVLLMALAGAVIYGPRYANRTPALKPSPQMGTQKQAAAGDLTRSLGLRWVEGKEVRRGGGWIDIVGPGGTVIANAYVTPDVMTVYDHLGNTLRSYSFVGDSAERRLPEGIGALLHRQGKRVGTVVTFSAGKRPVIDEEGNFVPFTTDEIEYTADVFDTKGAYVTHLIKLPDGRLGRYNAEGDLVPMVDRDGGAEAGGK